MEGFLSHFDRYMVEAPWMKLEGVNDEEQEK